MKKVAIVCAAGKEGKLLVSEALSRGYEVTGFVRKASDEVASPAKKIVKDLFDLTREDLAGFDVVIDAFGAWTPETLPLHKTSLRHLCDVLSGTDVRLLVVGGAGSLFVNPEHTATVDQGPDFPEDWKPLSAAHGAALANLRERTNVAWTYVSPAADFQADGKRTGAYTLAGEELTLNAAGQSTVSYADYAIAIVDLLESGEHVRERVSVVSK